MGATQRLAVPAPSASSPSLSGCAQTLCAHTKRRGDDGHALRAFARRASGALYALACVALAAWTASFLWEASAADALASQPDSPVGRDDASLKRWLEAHVVALGGGDDASVAEERDKSALAADGWAKRGFRPDAKTRKRVSRAPAPRAYGHSVTAPQNTLPKMSGDLERIPTYAYRDALADRTNSNVLDVARMAAEDRRLSLRVEGGLTKTKNATTPKSKISASNVLRVVATHHKTGTALMHDIFSAIDRTSALKSKYGAFVDLRDMEDHPEAFSELRDESAERLADAGVALDYHLGKAVPAFAFRRMDGRRDDARKKKAQTNIGLPFALLENRVDGREHYRMVHVVRDPVEVLISGYLYHRRLPADERWLFDPAPGDALGRSHAEALRSASPTEAMRAELRAADDELRMLVLAYRHVERDPNAMNVKLESFFEDFDGAVASALRGLGFDEADVPGCVEIARAFDTKRWSEEERSRNEHFTQREDRGAFRDAVFADPFLNKTTAYARYALEYTDEWPEFDE
jgi:hypothetical protein